MAQQTHSQHSKLATNPFFTLLYVDSDVTVDGDKKKQKLTSHLEKIYYIGHDSLLLPFLTVEENILIGISKKELRDYLPQIRQWSKFFKLAESIRKLRPEQISNETSILVHLVRAFSLHRQVVLLDSISLRLPDDFVDSLLPTLIQLAHEQKISIIFITDQSRLIEKYPKETYRLNPEHAIDTLQSLIK